MRRWTGEIKHAVPFDDDIADKLGIKSEPGWATPFTRNDAPQARWRTGARVRKAKHETGDTTPLGTLGTVLGINLRPGSWSRLFRRVGRQTARSDSGSGSENHAGPGR